MVAALFGATIAALVLVVRLAALSVDDLGVSWGFGALAFRMRAGAIAACRVYRDAIAVQPSRGRRFTWYLCARDYGPFDELVAAFRRAGLPVTDDGGRTPFRARLQSYGTPMDVLLLLDIVGITGAFLLL
jgi:hypothetical protein